VFVETSSSCSVPLAKGIDTHMKLHKLNIFCTSTVRFRIPPKEEEMILQLGFVPCPWKVTVQLYTLVVSRIEVELAWWIERQLFTCNSFTM
jgi:hypothetical protein